MAFFSSHAPGSSAYKHRKLSNAISNIKVSKLIGLQQINLKSEIRKLFWINDNVIALQGSDWVKSSNLLIFHPNLVYCVEADFYIDSIDMLDHHKLLITSSWKSSAYNQIIYDLLQRKVLKIFFQNSKAILSNQKLLFSSNHNMSLVSLKEKEIEIIEWWTYRDIKNSVLLSENKVIIDDKQGFNIYDFSSKNIYSITACFFKFLEPEQLKGYEKRVFVVNKNQIIVQPVRSSKLFKVSVPDDLDDKPLMIEERVNLKKFVDSNLDFTNPCQIHFDMSHQCLWIVPNSDKWEGILKLDLNDLSSCQLVVSEDIWQVIKVVGDLLFCECRNRSEIIVGELKDNSLDSLYRVPKLAGLFNKI